MQSYAPFFKANFYIRSELFTVHNLIHLIQSQQLCIFVHNSETLCYFRESFRPVVHNGGLKDFLMNGFAHIDNVAKLNLQLVIYNNEMLDDAPKRDTSGQSKGVGWHWTSGHGNVPRASLERPQSVYYPHET
jgi:hypothetical protein